mmetsp:Transcript_40889/g.98171  ORF Transcript_40889/g.98171 Transcript_40889/m.98171 type:complete len:241 (+) Transcript_40889:133-855(+)
MGEKRLEELEVVLQVIRTHGLPYRVHRPLGDPDINGANSQVGAQHWADGGAAWAIVFHHEILNGNRRGLLLGHFSGNRHGGRVRHVPLVCVLLDYNSFMHHRTVLSLVLARIVGVHTVGHISRNQDGILEGPRLVHAQSLSDSGHPSLHSVGVRPHPTLAPHLLMVEADGAADAGGRSRVGNSLESTPCRAQIVQPTRFDELVVHAPRAARGGIHQAEIQINDLVGINTQLLRQDAGQHP